MALMPISLSSVPTTAWPTRSFSCNAGREAPGNYSAACWAQTKRIRAIRGL